MAKESSFIEKHSTLIGILFWGTLILLAWSPWQDRSSTPTFKGYNCTEDCSGHIAGYEWAEEKGISDTSDCGGYSQSFIEGCWAYVDDNY